MTDHVMAKHQLLDVGDVEEFESILRQTMLSNTEKELLRLFYVGKKSMGYIADKLHLGSDKQASRMHRKAMQRVHKVLKKLGYIK